jgi:hypothetical protein
MRKLINTRRNGNYRSVECPHCEDLIIYKNEEIKECGKNEVGRYNLSDNEVAITYNFNCKECKGELQTSISVNSHGRDLDS